MSDTTTQPETSTQLCNGIVKWFNNKSGYGFITLKTGPIEGDIFVHHSSLSVNTEQYKYLVQGEYDVSIPRSYMASFREWLLHQAEGFGAGLEFDELIARDASVERQQQAARSLREARNTGSIVAGGNLMATQISVIAIGK